MWDWCAQSHHLLNSVEGVDSYFSVGSNPTKQICQKWWKIVLRPLCDWRGKTCSRAGAVHQGSSAPCWHLKSLFFFSDELSFNFFFSFRNGVPLTLEVLLWHCVVLSHSLGCFSHENILHSVLGWWEIADFSAKSTNLLFYLRIKVPFILIKHQVLINTNIFAIQPNEE